MSEMGLDIRETGAAEVAGLTQELDGLLTSLYPAESNHLVDPTELTAGGNLLLGAFFGQEAVGCVGFIRISGSEAEIKRLYVAPAHRGCGIGRALVQSLEKRALVDGIEVMRLETGIYQPESVALYEKAGYRRTAPFGHYLEDPLSVFMAKTLTSFPSGSKQDGS